MSGRCDDKQTLARDLRQDRGCSRLGFRVHHKAASRNEGNTMKRCAVYTISTAIVLVVLFLANTLLRPITFSPTVDLDPDLPSITLDGYPFHSETMGNPENPVVIALHGGPGGDYRNLLPIAPLSTDHYLVFYDQRMTGLSSRQSDGVFDLESFFSDLDLFVDHFGAGRPVTLLGHSWGAMLASGYASRFPEKVHRLVLIEPGLMRPDLSQPYFEGQSGPGWSAYPALAWIWLNSWRVDTRDDIYAREDYILSTAYPVLPGAGVHCGDVVPEGFEGWRASQKTMDDTVFAYVNDPERLSELDFVSDAHRFEGQTLFIGSTCNTVYGAAYQERHLPFFRDARLEVIEDAGHFVFYDQPDAALEIIGEFLAD